jgi:hypothetical protein
MDERRLALQGDDDGNVKPGFRRSLPDSSIEALGDLLEAVRRVESAAGVGDAATKRIRAAIELLWGRETWERIFPPLLREQFAKSRREPAGEVKVPEPDIATMALKLETAENLQRFAAFEKITEERDLKESLAEHARSKELANWACGRGPKPKD